METRMKPINTGQTKKIFGRAVPVLAVDKFQKEVKQFGKAGGHIHFPRKYVGAIAEIQILQLNPFVCRKCYDVFSMENHFSPEEDMCRFCYWEKQKFENYKKLPKNKQLCNICKEYLSPEDFEGNWSGGMHLGCVPKYEKMKEQGEIEDEEDYILDEEQLKSEDDNL